MKKTFLYLIVAAVLSLSLAGAASAFSFDLHGSMLNTMTSTNNANTLKDQLKSGITDIFTNNTNGNGKTANYWNTVFDEGNSVFYAKTKVRLRFEGKSDDGRAKFVYGFEGGGYYWGDTNFDLSGDSKTTETRFAYAQLAILNGKITAGLQKTGLNQWVWTETAAGLKYQTEIKDLKLTVAWFRGYDEFGSTSKKLANNNDDFFFLKTEGRVNNNLNLGFFGLYDHLNKEKKYGTEDYAVNYTARYYWLGINGKFKANKIFGNFDAIYNGGYMDFNSGTHMTRRGYLGNLTVGYKINDRFKASLNTLYVSGDDNPSDDTANNFDSVDVDIKCGIVLFTKDSLSGNADNFVSDGPFINDKGLINIALQGEYQIDPKNKVRAAVRKLYTAEDMNYIASKPKSNDIGYEFDLWYAYKYNKNVVLKAEFGYLVTGDGADQLAGPSGNADNNIYQTSVGMVLKF